jgi:hypothetical protein
LTTQTVIVVSCVVVIVVAALASSSSLFFTFVVVIPPPPHNAIPPFPSAQWMDGAVVVGSVYNNHTKNAIVANATMTPAHANCQG